MRIDVSRIKLLIAEQEINQTILAERCGISRQNISTIMTRGTCAPRNAGKLARGLGVPISEIIKED